MKILNLLLPLRSSTRIPARAELENNLQLFYRPSQSVWQDLLLKSDVCILRHIYKQVKKYKT